MSASTNDKGTDTTIVDNIRSYQTTLRNIAYERFKTYILSFVTKESMMKHTKEVTMHFDTSHDYMSEALGDVITDLEEVYKLETYVERVICEPHDLTRVTLSIE